MLRPVILEGLVDNLRAHRPRETRAGVDVWRLWYPFPFVERRLCMPTEIQLYGQGYSRSEWKPTRAPRSRCLPLAITPVKG